MRKSSTTLTMPRRIDDVAHQLGGPGVDLLVALLGEPGAILLRVGRQTGRCHGSSWRSVGSVVAEYARRRRRAPAIVRRASAASRRALRPVVEQLGQPAPEAARARRRSGASATRSWSAVQVALGQRRRRASRVGPALERRSAPPPGRGPGRRTASQLVPLIATGHERHAGAQREVRRPLAQRQELALARVDPALAGDRDDAARSRGPRRPGGSPRAGRSCPACTGSCVPVQCISRFRPPTAMSSSFGPKNDSRGRNGRTAISTNGSVQLRWLKQ